MSTLSVKSELAENTNAPSDNSFVRIGIDTDTKKLFSIDSAGNITHYGATIDAVVTESSNGLMIAADKRKLDTLGAGKSYYIDGGQVNAFGTAKFVDSSDSVIQGSASINTIEKIQFYKDGSDLPLSNLSAVPEPFSNWLSKVEIGGLIILTSGSRQIVLGVTGIDGYENSAYTFTVSLISFSGSWTGSGYDWLTVVRPGTHYASYRDLYGIVGNSRYLGTNSTGVLGVYDLPLGLTPEQITKLNNLKLGVTNAGYSVTRNLVAYTTNAIGEALLTTTTKNETVLDIDHDGDYYLQFMVRAGDYFSLRINNNILTGKITAVTKYAADPAVVQYTYSQVASQTKIVPALLTGGVLGTTTIDFSRPGPAERSVVKNLELEAINASGALMTKGQPLKLTASANQRSALKTGANDIIEGVNLQDASSGGGVQVVIDGFVTDLEDHVWDISNRLVHPVTNGTKLYYKKTNGRLTIDSDSTVECGSIVRSSFILPNTGYWNTSLLTGNSGLSTEDQANATRNTTIVVPTADTAVTRSFTLPDLSVDQVYTNPFLAGDRIAFVNEKNSNVSFVIQAATGTFKDIDGNNVSSYSLPSSDSHRAILVEVDVSPRGFKIIELDTDIITADIYFSMNKYLANK